MPGSGAGRGLRRTILLSPGDRAERLPKALGLGADAVAFDLEDGVAPQRKAEARGHVAALLRGRARQVGERRDGPECMVRINALDTPYWQDDLDALPLDAVDAVLLPKVEGPAALLALDAALTARGAACGIIATIETPRGLFNALPIADATPRLAGLFFGPGDYTMHTGAALSAAAFAYPRAVIAAAAGAVGCQAIDAPYLLDIKDADGTAQDAAVARELGFTGKVVFHPNQVAAVNAAFLPRADEVERARRILGAWRAAQARGEGVVFAEGEFIAVDLIPRLERILALAQH